MLQPLAPILNASRLITQSNPSFKHTHTDAECALQAAFTCMLHSEIKPLMARQSGFIHIQYRSGVIYI